MMHPNKFTRASRAAIFFALVSLTSNLLAAGEDTNPTGVSGVFNGNISTADEISTYDTWTENYRRGPIDDVVVPSTVGAYGLRFSRTYNSSDLTGIGSGSMPPGALGNSVGRYWRHSFTATVGNWGGGTPVDWKDGSGYVFPDGRVIGFPAIFDCPPDFGLPPIEERFDDATHEWIMADGGKIHLGHWWTYTGSTTAAQGLSADKITDPYGLETIIEHDISCPNCGAQNRIKKVTEPGGRYLLFTYIDPVPSNAALGLISRVEGFDSNGTSLGIWANYTYQTNNGNWYLTQVDYSDGTHAYYHWNYSATPVYMDQAEDSHYSSAMRRIKYGSTAGNNHPAEMNFFGEIVSQSAPTPSPTPNTKRKKETRGDGATRTFTYDATMTRCSSGEGQPVIPVGDAFNGFLKEFTDFEGKTTKIEYETNETVGSYRYIKAVTDANNHRTEYIRDPSSWAITRINYADGSFMEQEFTDVANPYYLASRTAQRGPGDPIRKTIYTRDANHRITHIEYPDGSYEDFTYNNFGQVLTHRMTSGGIESFAYDPRGLKLSSTDALGNISTYTYYPVGHAWADRVQTVTAPPNASGFQATETYEYDRAFVLDSALGVEVNTGAPVSGRGFVTKITHADGTFQKVGSNIYGDKIWEENELGHRTVYTYDEYGRVTSVKNPLNQTATTSYLPWGQTSSLILTSNLPFVTTLPSGKKTNFYYDNNLRKTRVQQAPGTADEANSYVTYDDVGNMLTAKDPRNNITTYVYDVMNRAVSVTDPANHTTSTTFDLRGLKTTETHANGQVIEYDGYDVMNRPTHKKVHRDASTVDQTSMAYDTAGNLASNTDENGNVYSYQYDLMNRRLAMIYPNNLRESTTYDGAGNSQTYVNRSGAAQTFSYDNRNRQTGFSWSDGTSPQTSVYDNASRKIQVVNNDATINFTYDNASRLLTQEEWTSALADNVHRTVTYTYDSDGNRLTVQYPSGAAFNYTYTNRNQPSAIRSGATAIASYGYDLSGNITSRTLNNGTSTSYTIDNVNRLTNITHNLVGGSKSFDYAYNTVNDITAVKRDGALGDGFTYDLNQQIIGYRQNGTVNLGAGTVTGGTLNSLAFDGCGNMTSKNDAPYLPANNMNQPTDPGITYDLNGNLKTYNGYVYNYDAQNRLRSVINTNNVTVAQFWYDGLNRQVARSTTAVTIPNLPVTTTTFSVWDGDWAILEEYTTGNVLTQSFVQGAHGLVKTLPNNIYYYQEALGSTSHVANSAGALVEYYKYDLYGKPTYWSPTNSQLPSSNFGIQDLHGGQRWMPQLGLYDDRNRFMSPDLGTFLQPDPIGFKGDASNLYRYCGNDWANRTDPMGLEGDAPMANLERRISANDHAEPMMAEERMRLGRIADGGSGIAAAKAMSALTMDRILQSGGPRSSGDLIKRTTQGFHQAIDGIESYIRGVGRGLDAAAGLSGLKGEEAQKIQQQAIADIRAAFGKGLQEAREHPKIAREAALDFVVLRIQSNGMQMAGRFGAAQTANQTLIPLGRIAIPLGLVTTPLAIYGDATHMAVRTRQTAQTLHLGHLLDSALTGGSP